MPFLQSARTPRALFLGNFLRQFAKVPAQLKQGIFDICLTNRTKRHARAFALCTPAEAPVQFAPSIHT